MYKEIHKGSGAKSYMINGLLIRNMVKYLLIFSYIRIRILWSPSSYITLYQIPSVFPYIWGFCFLTVWVGSVGRFKVREKRKDGWIYWQKKLSWQFRPLDCMPMFSKEGAQGSFYQQNVIELWRWICISTCRVLKISCIFRKWRKGRYFGIP